MAHKTTGIGAAAMVVDPKVTLHITTGKTEYVPIREKTPGPHYMEKKGRGVV